MEFGFELEHGTGRKCIPTDNLFRLPTSQIDYSDIEDDILAYKVDYIHATTDFIMEMKVERLTVQPILLAQEEDTICHLLAKYADVFDSS